MTDSERVYIVELTEAPLWNWQCTLWHWYGLFLWNWRVTIVGLTGTAMCHWFVHCGSETTYIVEYTLCDWHCTTINCETVVVFVIAFSLKAKINWYGQAFVCIKVGDYDESWWRSKAELSDVEELQIWYCQHCGTDNDSDSVYNGGVAVLAQYLCCKGPNPFKRMRNICVTYA